MLTLAIYEAPTMCNGCHIPHQASSRESAKQTVCTCPFSRYRRGLRVGVTCPEEVEKCKVEPRSA